MTENNIQAISKSTLTYETAREELDRQFKIVGSRMPFQERINTLFQNTMTTLAESIISIPEAYYGYVVREGSITRNKNVSRNAEILDAFDDLKSWFTDKGLWETYYPEFTKLAVDHILLAGSVRVLRADPKNELLDTFQQYMHNNFPDYLKNPYLPKLSAPHKLALKLLRAKRYTAVKALFEIRDKLA